MKSMGPIVTGMTALLAASVTLAQSDVNAALQEKLAAVKQAAAENKQKLQQYTWIETTPQVSLKRVLKRSSVSPVYLMEE
jgi:hypothetical protein